MSGQVVSVGSERTYGDVMIESVEVVDDRLKFNGKPTQCFCHSRVEPQDYRQGPASAFDGSFLDGDMAS